MKSAINLQDLFLNQCRKDQTPITIFLISGYQIRGLVKGFDSYTIVLDSEGKQQMIYKHAISTIMPSGPLSLYDGDDANDTTGTPSANAE